MRQLPHVSKYFKFRIEEKKSCFESVVSEIHKKNLFCPYDPPKIIKVFYGFYLILVFELFSKSNLVDT